jgi:tetratricopeptide (TPR) repeat protein
MGTETREIALNSIASTADSPYSLEGLTRAPPDREPDTTLKLLGADAAAKMAERIDATVKARDAAIAQGHVLEAELFNMALLIIRGDGTSLTPWLAEHREAIQKDESARLLSASLASQDAAGAQKALQSLAGLHRQSGNAEYMLNVFEGNTLFSLGDGKAGADHLLAALQVNPYLLGAWSDLAGHYYQSYEADKAWACWDAARRVNPQHKMLQRITDMERQLRTAFPEFF